MRFLPPLILRAFESAARTGSYVAAAGELGVSAAAVSQHVKTLEAFLGKQLFMRFNNRIVLTDAGQAIFRRSDGSLAVDHRRHPAGHDGQGAAEAGGQRVALRGPPVDGATAGPLHRSKPRLPLRAPGVEDDPVDFARHDIDLRMCYGTNLYPELRSVPLAHDEVLPLCSPAYLARHPAAGLPLLAGFPTRI